MNSNFYGCIKAFKFMKEHRARIINCALLLLIAVITLFIFANSTMDWETSHNLSDAVTDILSNDESGDNEPLVRKIAHVVEFAALGAAVMCFVKHTKKVNFKRNIGFALLYFFGIASFDEFIQRFFDRTSSIRDVGLDIFGTAVGFLVTLLIYYIIGRNKEKQERKNEIDCL